MKNLVRLLVGVVVIAVLAVVGWRVFEHFDQQDKIKNAKKSCATFDVPSGSSTLPTGFTLPAGQKLLTVQTTGKTSVVFASLPGQRSDLVSIRDLLGTGPLSSREEIVELEPPRRLGYVLRSGESLHHYRATVDLTAADGGGTRILWSGTVESRVPGVAPALRAVFHALIRGFARRLARAAETAGPTD